MALVLSDVSKESPFTSDDITAAKVAELNGRILAVSHNQVFGASRASLIELSGHTNNLQSA